MKFHIPDSGRTIIADVAAQNPTVQSWLAGWFAGKGQPPGQGRLVVEVAYVEVQDGAAMQNGERSTPDVIPQALIDRALAYLPQRIRRNLQDIDRA